MFLCKLGTWTKYIWSLPQLPNFSYVAILIFYGKIVGASPTVIVYYLDIYKGRC
jgi:hypothetical protein